MTPSNRKAVGDSGLAAADAVPDGAVTWRSAFADKPEQGRKIIAVYDDASGAEMFFVHEGGLIDAEGDERDDLDGFSVWAYLPPDLKFWCELREDDAFTFPPWPLPEQAA